MFCPKCGYQNAGSSTYCAKCGSKLDSRKINRWRKPAIIAGFCVAAAVLMMILLVCHNEINDRPQHLPHETTEHNTLAESTVDYTVSKNLYSIEAEPTQFTTPAVDTVEDLDHAAIEKYPIAVDGGRNYSVILYNDGTVATIGDDTFGQRSTSGWQNIIQISAFSDHTLGLKSDGTVVAVGNNGQGQCNVSDWKDIVFVAAGSQHSVGVRSDGTVVAVGINNAGQCDVGDWQNIVAVAANSGSTFGVTAEGRVLVCGSFYNQGLANWSDIVNISVSANHVVGVHSDGTVSAVGANDYGQCDDMAKWRDTQQVAAGYGVTAGLRAAGTVWVHGADDEDQHSAMQWTNIAALGSGTEHILGIQENGLLVAKGNNDWGQCDVYLLNQQIEPLKVDLSKYMNTNIYDFVKRIGDMEDAGATSGIEFSNGKIIVCGPDPQYSEDLHYISIGEDCPYSIMGIEVGMSFAEAAEIAEECGTLDEDYTKTHRRYMLSDGMRISIWSDDGKTVSSVALFGN